MDAKKILSGAIVCTMGVFGPLLYLFLMVYVLRQSNNYLAGHEFVKGYIRWSIWLYAVGMNFTGACLIFAGIIGEGKAE